jgi:aminoglycoside 6'-N-acetyltransferase I
MEIINMELLSDDQIKQAAAILTESLSIGWPTFDDAMDEIKERLIPENVLLAAAENGIVLGWGGILPQYNGNVYELHPLVVREDKRNKHIGSAIVRALEAAARLKGGLTIFLGADDERGDGETSFANADLYDNLPERIRDFQAGTHQAGFYIKLGYKIIGVIPDANGRGKPDIYLGKRL